MYTMAVILLFSVAMFCVIAVHRRTIRRMTEHLDDQLAELYKAEQGEKDENNPAFEWGARMENYFVTSFLTACCTGILTEAMEKDDRSEFLREWRQKMRGEINAFTNLYQGMQDDPEQPELGPVIGGIIGHYADGEELRMDLDATLTHIYNQLRRNLTVE